MATIKPYALFLFFVALAQSAYAEGRVFHVRPIEIFQHEVEVKLPSTANYSTISITGPRLFCQITPCKAEQNAHSTKPSAYNWYKIVGNPPPPLQAISVNDPFQNGQTIRLGNPAYFMIPTIVLGDSAADKDSSSTNIMLAFEYPQQIAGAKNKHFYFCLPVTQRHHDEIYKAIRPLCQYVVQKTIDRSLAGEISSVDQFGLHRVKRLSSRFTIKTVDQSKP